MGGLFGAEAVAQSVPSDFTSATRYDAERRIVGTIAPDPDGPGPLHYAATRTSYDASGRPIAVENGELLSWQAEGVAPVGNDPINSRDPSGMQDVPADEPVVTGDRCRIVLCVAPGPLITLPRPSARQMKEWQDNFVHNLTSPCFWFWVQCSEPSDKEYEGETPDDNPDDFRDLGPSKGWRSKPKLKESDGSVWEADTDGHADSKWKRWPNPRFWEKDKDRESVRGDGSVR